MHEGGSAASILVVDDDQAVCTMVAKAMRKHGYDVRAVNDGRAALQLLHSAPAPDLGLVDLQMPRMTGVEMIRQARADGQTLPLIVLTGHATIENAVEAMRAGANDFLTKPFNMVELAHAVQRALRERAMELENAALRRELEALGGARSTVVQGNSESMRRVWALVEKVAGTSATVLLCGENGTGKSTLARAIHRLSPRADEPFLALSCAALPAALLESELFGRHQDSHQDAVGVPAIREPGRFERASDGTLFLDEIGSLSLPLQAKLVRLLQEGDFEPQGGTETLTSNARLVAATNVDLAEAVEHDEFRQDLYTRLNVIMIEVPPLRQRSEDIPALVQYFVEHYSRQHGRAVESVAPEAMTRLRGYDWPGNVRELENAIERGVVLSQAGVLGVDNLPPTLGEQEIQPDRIMIPVGTPLSLVESRLLHETLRYAGGDRATAAALLGISVRTLYRRLAQEGRIDQDQDDLAAAGDRRPFPSRPS